MTHPSPDLQVHGLSFGYPQCAVLDNFHATLSAGLTLVRGDESCGKTTLLRLLAGELAPQAGRLVLAGLDARTDPDAYRARVFWADPRSDALNDLTPRGWFTGLSQQHGAWDAAALQAHLAGFLLQTHLDKPLHALSAGSRRKVLMAGRWPLERRLRSLMSPLRGWTSRPWRTWHGRWPITAPSLVAWLWWPTTKRWQVCRGIRWWICPACDAAALPR
ncbi:ABC transporter ATP-binding protein [Acidovorax carolinensis]|uniref:ABC transporter ATP-binding protein n=1 Tax=Acidovorax carolinensis TaxID=553814 RepID=UPI001F00E866|nr:ATP-binding cassette domain-containing protein [Acidovorax carolinensis]